MADKSLILLVIWQKLIDVYMKKVEELYKQKEKVSDITFFVSMALNYLRLLIHLMFGIYHYYKLKHPHLYESTGIDEGVTKMVVRRRNTTIW